MKVNQLAVALFEALQDKKDVSVLRKTIGNKTKYFLQIVNKRHPISESFALGAIKWGAKLQ